MTRTWDDNRRAINQLWPMMEFTEEEKRLWHDDLSGLDQGVLYDAIRNVKRNNDTHYPQIKWVRDEYRTLSRLANVASKRPAPSEQYEKPKYDDELDRKIGDELRCVVESATAADYCPTISLIAEKAAVATIRMPTAFRLVSYLNERLGFADGGVL